MNWRIVADKWNEENELAPPEISGDDLYLLALVLTGVPSPRGSTPVQAENIRAGIIPNAEYYKKVVANGNYGDAIKWFRDRFPSFS